MTDKDLPVKELSVTIQRGKHNKENPYVQISKKMLRDPQLSPKSKGVLCYLLSLPDTWQTHPRQVAEALGVGKDQVYSVLKELLKTGYANKREIKGEKGRFGSLLYEFYEDKLPENERFKEKITVSGNPDTVNPDTETPTLENIYLSEERPYSSLKVPDDPPANAVAAEAAEEILPSPSPVPKPKRSREPSAFSAKVKELADKMVNFLASANPDWLIPKNLHAVLTQVDLLVNHDKRDPERLFRVFSWAVSDHFWMDKISKPNPAKYLRDNFAQLAARMDAKPKTNPNEIDRRLKDKEGNVVDAYKDLMF